MPTTTTRAHRLRRQLLLPAGAFRQRTTIQVRTLVEDGHGGFIETWVDRRRRWPALVAQLTGDDLFWAQQVDPRAAWRVTLRYWPTYVEELGGGRVQLVYHDTTDRIFELTAPPQELPYHEAIVITAKEAA